ncbi:hypothetical protein [Thiomicrorhabdus aquaedulcis]|uniref:hypothetical protein n=1 Tax=Thiomicrorhabdus aquaedulcis TaxID=2211106 RepID=UPI000FD78532|nr:hypothetical protein [Thiomicrorhabdus aquaedulcis]
MLTQAKTLHTIEQRVAQLSMPQKAVTPVVINDTRKTEKTDYVLSELNVHLKALYEQHATLELQIKALAQDFKTFSSQPTEPAPYSYKAK